MTIALFASDKLPLSAIETSLRREGVSVSSFILTSQLSHRDTTRAITRGVLVSNETGIVNIGEQTEQVRSLIGKKVPLVLCVPQLTALDREMLFECGASDIVTPQSWNTEHIGERVLSQMVLGGDITPRECGALRGATIKVRDLYSHIERLAPLFESILILGETGTGKELVARELHNRSGRVGAYVPINCPEINPDLISSELFGHMKGAFSGADKTRVGLIASAGNGTVFLDEIGDLDWQSQAKLLRVLEDRKVRKVGANHFEPVQARIILATNRNLQVACAEGKFRPDLYERIRGFTVELPPLRERKADILILAHHFVNEYNDEYKTNNQIPAGSMDCLFQYDWPGNIRELRAVIRRATAYSDSSGYISSLILQESVRRPQTRMAQNAVPFEPAIDTWRDLQRRAQTIYFRALLAYTNGNRESATKLSGLSKSQFFEKLKELSKGE
jgi:DNA-binding NtrC family response regulator